MTCCCRASSSAARSTPTELDGYWRDLGQPHHYLNAHLELLDREAGPVHQGLADPHPAAAARAGAGPRERPHQRQPAQLGQRRGRHRRPERDRSWVVVEAGAEVVESVVFGDTVVRSGATGDPVDRRQRLRAARRCRVGDSSVALDDPDAIPIVGRESTVGSALPPGSRLAPGTTA